jgi:site-specific DNA recombinase
MKAAIYARTATADKSTDAQIAACRAIAESNGYHVSQIFSETGQSGANVERHGLASLLREAQEHAFDAVIVTDLDRLSRDASDTGYIFGHLQSNGVRIFDQTGEVT